MKSIFRILPIVFLMGCMTGEMRGMVSDGTAIVVNYQQEMMSDLYTTNINGQNFSGRAVSIDQSASFGTAFGTASVGGTTAFGSSNIFTSSMGGKFRAILLGDKGSSLKCLMQYADASGFTSMGGVGECLHSDGRKVDIIW